jgi:hypothetical protein
MNSLELKAKTQEELLDWRHALQRAMTPSASSIEEHMVETKKIHMQMSEVIQKHIDALQHDDGSLDSMMGAALQVRRTRAQLNSPDISLPCYILDIHQEHTRSRPFGAEKIPKARGIFC